MNNLPEEWRSTKLGELIESAVDGPFGSNLKTEHYVDAPGVRVIRLQNLGVGDFIDDDRAFISDAHAASLSRHEVRPGDLLIASLGDEAHPVARACQYPASGSPAIVKADCFRIRLSDKAADPGFVRNILNCTSTREGLDGLSQGVTRDRVNLASLKHFRIALPPIGEQHRIVEILDTADEAIRSAERLIAKLEQAQRGLLRDLLTRGIDESGSLRDPATFVNTPLGRRPNSWVVLRVEELLEGRPKNGYSPKEVDQWTGTLMLGLGCLTQSGFRPLQLKNAPSRDAGLKRAVLNDGDLLISRANTRELVGLVGRFQELGIPCTYPDLMMRLRPNHRVLPEYLEIALRAPSTRRHIRAAASGTSGSMVKISSSVLCNLLTAIPEIAEQRRIIRVLNGAAIRIGAEERRLVKLRLVKEGLADDLLTGRVRVGALG